MAHKRPTSTRWRPSSARCPLARNHQAWWGNHEGNLQAISWMNAGWKVNALSLADQHLTFSRTGGPTVAARAVAAPASMSVGASGPPPIR